MYKEIIINTFDAIFKNSNNLTVKLFIPILFISVINYFIPQIITPEFINQLNIRNINFEILAMPLLLIFILIMANISIAIATHRVIILGDDSVSKFGSFIFGLREFKFLFKTILLSIIISLPITIVSIFIPIAGPLLGIILALILVSRLSFVFPALACDEKISFFQAWKYTRNYKILTIFTIIILPLLFTITVGFVYSMAIEFLIKLVSSHLTILYSILNVFIMVFSVSALTSTYLYIKPEPLNEFKKNQKEPIREIIQSSSKNTHKVIIHDKHKVSFESLKKELQTQYSPLNFTDIAYDRKNSYLLKNPENLEAFVSLRYAVDEFTVVVNNSDKPQLKILASNNKNKEY